MITARALRDLETELQFVTHSRLLEIATQLVDEVRLLRTTVEKLTALVKDSDK